jgi:hypothetical protein
MQSTPLCLQGAPFVALVESRLVTMANLSAMTWLR